MHCLNNPGMEWPSGSPLNGDVGVANNIYLTIKGNKQGLISAGCCLHTSVSDSYPIGRKDQALVLQFEHIISRSQQTQYHPIKFCKPIDKSSPRLGIAISSGEELELLFDFYRTSEFGGQEKCYSIFLTGVTLTNISVSYPHAFNSVDEHPGEIVTVTYSSIDWQQNFATSGR